MAAVVLDRADDGCPIIREAPGRERNDRASRFPRAVGLAQATEPTQGRPIINARIEKLAVPGFWLPAFSSSRCLVAMAGYYEWTGERGAKIPHYIHSDGLLAAAGLTWTADIGGERRRVYVVITREARDASGEVHDRMPAFLTPDLVDEWLSSESLTVTGGTRRHPRRIARRSSTRSPRVRRRSRRRSRRGSSTRRSTTPAPSTGTTPPR